nr:uncharacterized protein LOC123772847 isoform X5 [Procambarus clarkii]
MTSQVVDPSGQASQEARRAVWRGPAWGEVLLSARLIGFTKLVTWTVLCMRLPAPGLQVCTRVHQYNGTAAMVNHIQEICLVQRHCRCVGAAGVCKDTSGVYEGATGNVHRALHMVTAVKTTWVATRGELRLQYMNTLQV